LFDNQHHRGPLACNQAGLFAPHPPADQQLEHMMPLMLLMTQLLFSSYVDDVDDTCWSASTWMMLTTTAGQQL